MKVRIGVLTFPGTTDDVATIRALQLVGATPVPCAVTAGSLPDDLAGLIIPGGMPVEIDGSFPGSASNQGAARAATLAAVHAYAQAGNQVLGIGSGCKLLVDLGVLPGSFAEWSPGVGQPGTKVKFDTSSSATRFWQVVVRVRVEPSESLWLSQFEAQEEVLLPATGPVYAYQIAADAPEVVLRVTQGEHPSSVNGVVGVRNATNNVTGLLVNPEYAVERNVPIPRLRVPYPALDGFAVFAAAVRKLAT